MLKKITRKFKSIFSKKKKYRKTAKYPEPVISNNNGKLIIGVIAYNKYGGYCIPSNCRTRPAARKVLNGQVYEYKTVEYMIENCGNGDIVHAGTFYGDFLPGLSTGISEHARIWAFEPNYENFRCAQITTILNDLDNVILNNFGLGEKRLTESLRIQRPNGKYMGGGSEIVREHDNGGGTIVDIEVKSLDECIPDDRNISIIQFDIEGYIDKALKGSMSTIKRCKPILILEDENNFIEEDWFKNNILLMGYTQTDEFHGNTVFKYV